MKKKVYAEDVLQAVCVNCDSRFEMCEECPIKDAIMNAPDAVPVVHGEWTDEVRGRWVYAKCDRCGKVQDVKSNYCPNCGARMWKGANDDE